jgi:Uncharacterised protein family (UPF0172)
VVDAVPFFHLTALAPMLEVACGLADAYAQQRKGQLKLVSSCSLSVHLEKDVYFHTSLGQFSSWLI